LLALPRQSKTGAATLQWTHWDDNGYFPLPAEYYIISHKNYMFHAKISFKKNKK
jgi:hypothetical protein